MREIPAATAFLVHNFRSTIVWTQTLHFTCHIGNVLAAVVSSTLEQNEILI